MDKTTREEITISRDEYIALVRDREILDIIEADHAAQPNCPGSLKARIGELLDAGLPPTVILARAEVARTRREAARAALRRAAPRAGGLVCELGNSL